MPPVINPLTVIRMAEKIRYLKHLNTLAKFERNMGLGIGVAGTGLGTLGVWEGHRAANAADEWADYARALERERGGPAAPAAVAAPGFWSKAKSFVGEHKLPLGIGAAVLGLGGAGAIAYKLQKQREEERERMKMAGHAATGETTMTLQVMKVLDAIKQADPNNELLPAKGDLLTRSVTIDEKRKLPNPDAAPATTMTAFVDKPRFGASAEGYVSEKQAEEGIKAYLLGLKQACEERGVDPEQLVAIMDKMAQGALTDPTAFVDASMGSQQPTNKLQKFWQGIRPSVAASVGRIGGRKNVDPAIMDEIQRVLGGTNAAQPAVSPPAAAPAAPEAPKGRWAGVEPLPDTVGKVMATDVGHGVGHLIGGTRRAIGGLGSAIGGAGKALSDMGTSAVRGYRAGLQGR